MIASKIFQMQPFTILLPKVSKFLPPNTQDGMLGQGVKDSDLPKLYRCPFHTTKEVTLVIFQFKINHNIVYTKDKLMKAKMSTSNLCYLCI